MQSKMFVKILILTVSPIVIKTILVDISLNLVLKRKNRTSPHSAIQLINCILLLKSSFIIIGHSAMKSYGRAVKEQQPVIDSFSQSVVAINCHSHEWPLF